MMEKRRLGREGPYLSEIGLGAWAIGGAWLYGWGKSDEKESIRAIHRAIDLGINWVDTAAVYGLGASEEIVGKAIKGFRDQVFIATKCGLVWDTNGRVWNDISPKSIRKEVEQSLKRLQVDVIDLYQIHWPHANQSEAQAWRELSKLKKEGSVRWIGVSNFDINLMQICKEIGHVDSLQPPYSLLKRDIEKEILSYCSKNGIGVICYSPMMSGLLTGRFDKNRLAQDDWRQNNRDFKEPRLSKNLELVNRLKKIADKYEKTVGQLAVAWVLREKSVTSAIVGARQLNQVEENVLGSGWQIEEPDLMEIEKMLNKHHEEMRLLLKDKMNE